MNAAATDLEQSSMLGSVDSRPNALESTGTKDSCFTDDCHESRVVVKDPILEDSIRGITGGILENPDSPASQASTIGPMEISISWPDEPSLFHASTESPHEVQCLIIIEAIRSSPSEITNPSAIIPRVLQSASDAKNSERPRFSAAEAPSAYSTIEQPPTFPCNARRSRQH